jgi:chromosome segregation ATPase
MEQAVRNLGNVRVNSSGSADGGSSKRTSKQKQEEAQVKATTQAYKEQAATFDQQAASVKRASRGSTLGLKKELDETSNSYSNLIQQLQRTITHFDVSPIQSLRMRQHELEAGMRTASNEAAKAKKDVDELNAAITNYRSTLETLPKNQQGFSNRQSIQKEINDLIVLRDTASAEQQKWENAGRQLASQYEIVKSEIRQIGQALIAAEESEKRVTTELDKQLQKINEISSRKTATQAYRDAISMETGNLE